MTVAIIVYILIVTAPLVGAAILTERLCRLWSLPVRGAWSVAALLIVLIGGRTLTQQLIAPQAVTAITAINVANVAAPTTMSRVASIQVVANELMSLPRNAAAYTAHVVGPAQNRSLLILWCVMSAAMLALICFVYTRVWYARRAWNIVDFAGHTVRVAPHAGPAVVGLFNPEIVVPRWVLEARPEDSHLIVMHEMEHKAARDPLLLAAMWGLVALVPWHPGAWYCLARTRLAIELDCDARVVGRGASLKTYAQLLVNQARERLAAPMHLWLGATSLLEPSSHLERRLRAMIVPNTPRPARRTFARYLRAASYVAIVSTAVIAACESHVPTAADISGLDAASAQKNAARAFVSDGKQPTFYLNGVAVSEGRAKAIAADSIGSIRIVRAKQPAGEQQVRIVTIDKLKQDGTLLSSHTDTVTFKMLPRDRAHVVVLGLADKISVSDVAITIDGVVADAAAYKALNPNDIATVDVIKGPAALKESTDPRAKNGLIRITLRH